MTEHERLLAISYKDVFIHPKQNKEWYTTEDPYQRNDWPKEKGEEDNIEDKWIYKLNLQSLSFEIGLRLDVKLLLFC